MVQSMDQYIFMEDDEVSCIYFLMDGDAGFVLPRHLNKMYIKFNQGC
mgnify:CR=1 FL=1